MRNRVKIEETKFHVDTENKVVVCVLKCNMQMNNHPAWRIIDSYMWIKKFPSVSWKGEFTVKAIARCNASDTFDVSLGKRIAEGRAKSKMLRTAEQVWECIRDALTKFVTECDNTSFACAQAREVEDNHVLKLIK